MRTLKRLSPCNDFIWHEYVPVVSVLTFSPVSSHAYLFLAYILRLDYDDQMIWYHLTNN